jgi:hypothetical protein
VKGIKLEPFPGTDFRCRGAFAKTGGLLSGYAEGMGSTDGVQKLFVQ